MYNGPNLVTNGLVLYLDAANVKSYSGSGLTWSDLTINKNKGILTNGPTFSSNSIGFDGVNDYVNFGDVYDFTNSSFSGFVVGNLGSTNSNYIAWIDKLASNGSWRFHSNLANQLIFGVRDTLNGYQSIITSTNTISLNNWYYMGFTYDFIGNSASIYVNGLFKATGVFTISIGNTTSPLYVGYTSNNNYYLSGKVSILQIYNRTLSASEILQNYNALKSRFNLN